MNSNDRVYIYNFISTLLKHKTPIFMIFVFFVGTFVFLPSVLKKKYRSHFVIHIHSKYFSNPLVSSIVPGVYSSWEMTGAMNSIIKKNIDNDFMDEVGEKFNVWNKNLDKKELLKAKIRHREKFIFMALSGQSYKIDYIADDADTAYEVMALVLDKVSKSFLNARIDEIKYSKEILEARLAKVDKRLKKIKPKKRKNKKINRKLLRWEEQLQRQQVLFSDKHPLVRILKKRIGHLKGILAKKNRAESALNPSDITKQKSQQVDRYTYQLLQSEYQQLSLAMELEKRKFLEYVKVVEWPQKSIQPVWPRKRIFYPLGVILGLIFSVLYVLFYEFLINTKKEKLLRRAKKLNTVFLGSFPESDLNLSLS